MRELKQRLHVLDAADPPELWSSAEERVPGSLPPIEVGGAPTGPGRRVAAAVVAFAVFIAAGLLAWQAFSPADTPPAQAPADANVLDLYVNPMGIAITLGYPTDWHAESVSQPISLGAIPNSGTQVGMVISNARGAMPSMDPSAPSPGPLPNDPRLPPNSVTVTILSTAPHSDSLVPDSALPLSMDDAKVVPGPANIRVLDAKVGGWPITISVHGGPEASAADLAAADAIVASVRPSNRSSFFATAAAPKAPAISGATLDGRQVTPSDLEGKTVVLGVWASWCRPCGAELEAMQQVATASGSDPTVVVLGVNLDTDPAAAASFAQRMGATFPSLADGGSIADELHLGGVPTIYVIDERGTIVTSYAGAPADPQNIGFVADFADQLKAAAERAQRAPSAPPPTTPTARPSESVSPQAARCNMGELRLGLGPVSEATGQHSRMLSFTNIASTPCSLLGYPVIAVLGPTDTPIPFRYRNGGDQMVTSQPPVTVTLAPGGVAYVMINKYRCDAGDEQIGKMLVVTLPGGTQTLNAPIGHRNDFSYCGPGDPGSIVSISPFEPTAAATSAR